MDYLAAVIRKYLYIFFIHADTVEGEETFIETTDIRQKIGCPPAQFFPQLSCFRLVFEKMSREREFEFVGQGLGILDKLSRAGVQ
jgi:hypothetical protein